MCKRLVAWSLASILALVPSCRDQSPEPEYNYNLGDARQPLLPTPEPSYDPGILEGTSAAPAARTARRPGPSRARTDEAAIRQVFGQIQQLAKKQDLAAVADFVVPDQRAVARKFLSALQNLGRKFDELHKAVVEKLPDQAGKIRMGNVPGGQALPFAQPDFEIVRVEIRGPDKAVATVRPAKGPASGAEARHVQIPVERSEGRWCIRLPEMPPPEQIEAMLKVLAEQVPAQIDKLIARIRAGELTSEQLGEEMMGLMFGMMAQLAGAAGQGPGSPMPATMPAGGPPPGPAEAPEESPGSPEEKPTETEPRRAPSRDTGTPLDTPTVDELLRHQY